VDGPLPAGVFLILDPDQKALSSQPQFVSLSLSHGLFLLGVPGPIWHIICFNDSTRPFHLGHRPISFRLYFDHISITVSSTAKKKDTLPFPQEKTAAPFLTLRLSRFNYV
jgi:hypothetical protein